MVLTDLHPIVEGILRQAREQGSVQPADVRAQLARAGQPEKRWKEVIELARPHLRYSKGRYHYVSAMTARVRQDQRDKRSLARAIRTLIRNYRKVHVEIERRQHSRIHFNQPLKITVADQTYPDFVCLDLSLTGMRFLGEADLRGQDIKVIIPTFDTGGGQWSFSMRVLWSCPVGKLTMQGGLFLAVETPSGS